MSTFIKARPTTYKGVQMRSRLEAHYAASLDEAGVEWEYEPRAFGDQSGQYLPDFYLPEMGGYVEVRPTVERAYEAFRQMPIIWSSEPDALLSIIVPDLSLCWVRYPTDATWRLY